MEEIALIQESLTVGDLRFFYARPCPKPGKSSTRSSSADSALAIDGEG